MKRLAVIPSDPLDEYLDKGYSQQRMVYYYNPHKFFDEVYLLSDLEKENREFCGMKIIHTPAKRFKKQIKELNVDVVRAYGGNWACAVACEHKVKGIPVVVSVHDTEPERLYDSVKKADVVWCVSEAVKHLVQTKFQNPDNVWILPNRVDRELMRPVPPEETRDLDEKYPFSYRILFVGRLTEQKNLGTLIQALGVLGKDYCLLVVGQGDTDVYKTLAADTGAGNRIFFMDSVEYGQLARYYSWADCMCVPSLWEGFGMVFIEAMASGGVVVTSDIGPMNEFIADGKNGVLVKNFENPAALAESIKKACCDQALRKQIKLKARRSVEPFDRVRIDKLEAGYYSRVLDMQKKGAFNVSLLARMKKAL